MERDKTNQKVALVAFVLAGALGHFVTRVLMETLGGIFPKFERWRALDPVQHGIPLLVAAGVFVYLQVSANNRQWADEVITEVRKIVWPSQKDSAAMTTVVCVMVVVAGIGLAVVDFLSGVLMKALVSG